MTWYWRASRRITRDGSVARKLPGKAVPSVIGTSPKTLPGVRQPMLRSTPSMVLVTSILPET
jgi:hypothetical protein